MSSLRTIYETCLPRDEVLSGELTDEIFAARLSDVTRGNAHPVYQEPGLFFTNTHPTQRMKSFLREVMGRLSGRDKTASSFFRVDTPFGGGKTHALIALYHLATASITDEMLDRMNLSRECMPEHEDVMVAAVVGDELDPTNGVDKGGVRVHHLWGELAFQLGGREGYELVERSDVQNAAPGAGFLDRLIGQRPALILIDEPALYMRKMGPNAGQLPAFLKTLAEWVTTSASRTVLVMTLAWNPDSKDRQAVDAFARETGQISESLDGVFREITSVVGRPSKTVTPAQEQDIAPILRQRLFKSVDTSEAGRVADAYMNAFKEAASHQIALPANVLQASYRQRIEDTYPFHPQFIEVLDGKLSTMPNFQKTRGALRLLSRVIRRMWQDRRDDAFLIHPSSVDLADPDIVDELSGRLDRPGFRSVSRYDVAREDGNSHAQSIDRERFGGHQPYAQRVATTVFLHSLPEPPARGIDLDELMSANVTPGTEPAHLHKAVEYLLDEAWHLDFEGRRYFFRTEASLNKIVLDEMGLVHTHDAREEVKRRVRQLWKDSGLEVVPFPAEPAGIPDEPKGKLIIIHWDTASFKTGDKAAPQHIRELWEYKGTQRDFRNYRNTLFFLVASTDRSERMVELARRWLALDGLVKNQRRLDEYRLSKEHRDRLDEWRKSASLDLRISVTRAYCNLFYPVADAAALDRPFAHHPLMIEDQGDTRVNHTDTILNTLRELGKIKSADDDPLSPALVRRDAFDKEEGLVPLRTLYGRFAERLRLPLLLEPTYIKQIVRFGVRNRQWLYYDLQENLAYDSDESLVDIAIDEQHAVATPEWVQENNIQVFRREPKKPPEMPEPPSGPGVTPESKPDRDQNTVRAEGEARQAFADLIAMAKDAGWHAISHIDMHWKADGPDAQARLSAVQIILGQMAGTSATISTSLSCQYKDGSTWQSDYQGGSDRYRQVGGIMETMAGQAKDAHLRVILSLDFAHPMLLTDAEIEDLREILDLANVGLASIEARKSEKEWQGR